MITDANGILLILKIFNRDMNSMLLKSMPDFEFQKYDTGATYISSSYIVSSTTADLQEMSWTL